MRRLGWFLFFAGLVAAACAVFYTARFSIGVNVAGHIPASDTLDVYINDQRQEEVLVQGRQAREYRPRIRTLVSGPTEIVERADVYVSVYSRLEKKMTFKEFNVAFTDRLTQFEFRYPTDFIIAFTAVP